MIEPNLASIDDVKTALLSRMRSGEGFTKPWARKWENAGCEPLHSGSKSSSDGLKTLCSGLVLLGTSLRATNQGVQIGHNSNALWVAANRSIRGGGPPDCYLIGRPDAQIASYVGDSPEVLLEILRERSVPTPPLQKASDVQVGFPGLSRIGATYVGSWQWDINGEASDEEFIHRSAAATLATIRAQEESDD